MAVAAMACSSQLVILEGAPHAILWTHADEVNQTLVDFLSGRTVGIEARETVRSS